MFDFVVKVIDAGRLPVTPSSCGDRFMENAFDRLLHVGVEVAVLLMKRQTHSGGFAWKAFVDKRSLTVSGPVRWVERDRVLRGRRCRGFSICFTGSYRPLCYATAGGNRGVSCYGIGRLGYLGNHIKVWVGCLPPHPPIASLSRYCGWSRVYLSDNEVSSGLVQLAFDVCLLMENLKQTQNENQRWRTYRKKKRYDAWMGIDF